MDVYVQYKSKGYLEFEYSLYMQNKSDGIKKHSNSENEEFWTTFCILVVLFAIIIGVISKLKEKFNLYGGISAPLEERIDDLMDFQTLNLGDNEFTYLPERIGDLKQLRVLYLGNNQLRHLPERIGDLIQLEKLILSSNHLVSLPERIGDLAQLQVLTLSNNLLRSLPRSITKLSNIVLLDVRNNPLLEHGEGDTLGWRELESVFGDKFVFSQYDNASCFLRVIQKQEVYDKLASMPLHWNVEKLRTIVLDPVPTHTLQYQEVLDIWKNALSRYEGEKDSNGRDVESYIKTIYDIDADAFKGWKMYPGSVENVKDLIEAIFVKLDSSIGTDEGIADAKAYVPEICEAMKWCPDRQMAAINMVYSALYSKKDTASLEYFIENEIASMKNYIFEITVIPVMGTQNVHVLNHWKYELGDELGFDMKYKTRMGTFNQDEFGGHVGNVLEAFYYKFTPEYVINNLVREINSKKDILCSSGLFLMKDMEESMEYRKRAFNFADKNSVEYLVFSGIKRKGVKDILVKMKILEENGNMSDIL